MELNWEAIGALAEALGALAVVVTLIYLSTQLRQNTKSIQSANYGTWNQAAAGANALAATTANIFEDALSKSRELEPGEKWAFYMHMLQIFNGFETVFLMHLHETIDITLYESKMRAARKLLASPGVAEFWAEWQIGYDERFVQYLEANVDAGDA